MIMRLLLTLIMAVGMCLTSFGAATWPASTNGNNTFFGNNTFKTPTLAYGVTVTNAGNTAYLYISGNSGIGGLTGVIESTPSGMVLSGDTGLGNSIQISPLGVLSGNGSGLTSLTIPDPLTLNQLNVNTLIVTNKFLTNSIGVTVDGAGTAISSGIKGYIAVPYACTIESCTLMADVAGTISFEFWRTNSADASYPPTASGAIGTNTLTADNYNVDSTLTGWTKTLAAGDVLGFNVPATATTITRCTAQLKVTH